MKTKYKKEIIYIRVPVVIEYEASNPKARKRLLSEMTSKHYPCLRCDVVGIGPTGPYSYKTKGKLTLVD